VRLLQENQGSITLDTSTVPAANNIASQPVGVCSYVNIDNEPAPTVVHVSCSNMFADELVPNYSRQRHYFAGCLSAGGGPAVKSLSAAGQGLAALILEYGAGPAVRTVLCDLKPGSYQLPPCTQVRASVLAYRSAAEPLVFYGGDVSIAICGKQVISNPTRAVITHGGNISGAANTGYAISVPAQVRWWDAWCDFPNIAPFATDAPTLLARGDTAASTPSGIGALIRDYTTGFFTPSWGPVEFGGVDSQTLVVSDMNLTGFATSAWLQFYLEL
jgi:hypothetical protein